MQLIIKSEFQKHIQTATLTMRSIPSSIEIAANLCIDSLSNGGKILIFGNGGSASDAQHIASELVGRYKSERKGLPAIALSSDTSALTSIGNDFGFTKIFERQVQALANHGDIAIGISTGGTSVNVINGLKTAKSLGCKIIGFSGRNGGDFNDLCNINIVVPEEDTPRIQEMHILIGHTICQLVDIAFDNSN